MEYDMSYTNFNMRLDNNLRGRAYPILEQYGLTPSQAVRMFFNQIAETGKVPLSFDWASKPMALNENGKRLLAESIADIKNGYYTEHTADEMINDLIGSTCD